MKKIELLTYQDKKVLEYQQIIQNDKKLVWFVCGLQSNSDCILDFFFGFFFFETMGLNKCKL